MLVFEENKDKYKEVYFKSSNVIYARYTPLSRETIILFKSGRTYCYHNTTLRTFLAFKKADSQGKALKEYYINNNDIKSERLENIDENFLEHVNKIIKENIE